MINRSIQAKLLVVAVFLVGIATGALVDNTYRTRMLAGAVTRPANAPADQMTPQEREKRRDDAMTKYLGLDQSQQDQVHKILEDSRSQIRQLHDQVDPKFQAIDDAAREKIRAILTDEQRRKGDAFRESHKGTRGNRGQRPPDKQDQDRDKH